MKDQVTSIEQSKRLIEMGVPADKASMVWLDPMDTNEYHLTTKIGYCCPDERDIPAFTGADLLGLLPPKISCQDPSDGNFRMRRYMGENGIEWVVDYDRFIANDVSIINALVETIILLVSTKHELNL